MEKELKYVGIFFLYMLTLFLTISADDKYLQSLSSNDT